MSKKNNGKIVETPLRVLSAEELARAEMEWSNSSAKKRIDEINRRLQAKISVKNVGSFSQIDRVRTFIGAESNK